MSNPTQGQPYDPNAQPSGPPAQGYGPPAQSSQPYGPTGTDQTYVAQQPYTPQQQQPYGAPQQPYGAPAGGGYGQPGYGGQPAVPPTNGAATAGLILGILPTGLIGTIVSIIGLSRASKLGGVGRGKALVGLILSIVWIIVYAVIIFAVAFSSTPTGKKIVERTDPGCVSVETSLQTLDTKMSADAANVDAFKADVQQAITLLNSDAGKSRSSDAAKAMRATAADFQELLTDLNNGTAPSADLQSRVTTDGTAIDTACGQN